MRSNLRQDPESLPALENRLATGSGWRDFLGGLDPVWQAVPTGFHEGPFLGNGGLSVSPRCRPSWRKRRHSTGCPPR
ncbi:hypothetical protein ACFXGT_29040 [Streptomyces sp. NPDC059352]|uniref:hypothetical protein n=1 Tax=Streptomyces sp. NPDC059352 TaxID=3346810 RepID=UPI0036B93EB0